VSRFGDQIDDESLALLDGIEVAHPVVHIKPTARAQPDALYARALRIKPAIAAIGASDFHFTAPMGTCRTLIFARELSQASVFDAIRAGRTVAVDRAGRAFGPPQWTSAAASHAAATLPAPPSNGWTQASVTLAWASLAALVVCGRGD
jgi:PHP-associated